MRYTLSQHLAHFFHVVSNVRPIVWIGLYVCVTPLFALIYWGLPEGQFRIPDNEPTDYGSWLYYSIVTITTLGFGDYTPAHGAAQAVTAVEVACGLIFLGFFLNSVAAMRSEIDVESEIEKQRLLRDAEHRQRLIKSMPMILHSLNTFLTHCDSFISSEHHSGSRSPHAVIKSASATSLALDSLQQRIDLTLWPQLLEDCFTFVANYQIFASSDLMLRGPGGNTDIKEWANHVADFIKENRETALKIEAILTEISNEKS